MQLRVEPLPIPARGVAGEGSFPAEPEAVADWLARLAPLESAGDARELLRGLVHSNRLHNDVARRRGTLARFVPPLRALHERLAETARAQPLPLTARFERDRALAADLLREESIAFRLLLVDSDPPREDDARSAMHALARLAELDANGYRRPEPATLSDAHALWSWAEAAGLDGSAAGDDALGSLGDHYRLILVLALVDPHRHRARQLPLLIDWLRREAGRVRLGRVPEGAIGRLNRRRPGLWLVDVATGTEPVPAGALLRGESPALLAVDTTALSHEADRRMAALRTGSTSLPGADTLERPTLGRLVAALGGTPGRRSARRVQDARVELVFGVRHICARLLYGPGTDGAADRAADGAAPADGAPAWRAVDRSPTGMRLVARGLRAGLVQVGELVTVHDDDGALEEPLAAARTHAATPGRSVDATADVAVDHGLLIGVVRRVLATRDGALHIGVEFIARQAMPVTVAREDDVGAAPEQALVVACRIAGRTLQTLLVPSFLYRTGDRLNAVRGERSRRLELVRCLQVNGLFSHYAVETTGASGATEDDPGRAATG